MMMCDDSDDDDVRDWVYIDKIVPFKKIFLKRKVLSGSETKMETTKTMLCNKL